MIATLLGSLATFVAVFYVPGRLLLERFAEAPEPEERLPFSIGLGIAAVGTLVTLAVGVVGLFRADAVVTPLVVGCAAIVVAAAAGLTGTRPLLRPRALLSRPTGTQAGLWALALAGFLFFAVHYDEELLREDGVVMILSGSMDVGILGVHTHPSLLGPDAGMGSASPPEGLLNPLSLLSGWDGEAVGPGIIPGVFLVLFGGLGMRLTYALAGLLLPGIGFVLGRAVFRRAWAGWAVALLLAFSPWALECRTFDKNFVANVFGSLALALLFRQRPAAALAGLATGFFLGVHHVELAALPAALWYLRRLRRDGAGAPRDWLRFLGAAIAGASPCLVLHVMFPILHNGGLLENTFARPLAHHSLFGLDFEIPMLWNYPFIPDLLRSPYHAYPPMVAYPLDIANRFGVALVALVPAGVAWFAGAQRARGVVLAAWFVPLMLFLAIQSNWMDPNKMGLPAMAAAPVVLAVVAGAAFLADRARSRVVRCSLAAVGLALPLGGVPILRGVDAAVDHRVWEYEDEDDGMDAWSTITHHLDETPGYVSLDRDQYRLSLIPSVRADHEWRPALLARSFRQLLGDLRHPALGDLRNSMPDFLRLSFWGFGVGIAPLRALHSGDPMPTIEAHPDMSPLDDTEGGPGAVAWLRLDESPILAESPLVPGPAADGVRPLLDGRSALAMVSGFEAPWAPGRGASVIAGRDRDGDVCVVIGPGAPNPRGRPSWLEVDRRDAAQFPAMRVPIRVPRSGVVRIVELRSYFPAVWYSRYALVEDDGARIVFTRPILVSPS